MKLFISRWVFKHSTAVLLLERRWSKEQAMGWKMGAVSFSFNKREKDLLFQQPSFQPGSKLALSSEELSWKSNFCSSRRPIASVQVVKANAGQFWRSIISPVMETSGMQEARERGRWL